MPNIYQILPELEGDEMIFVQGVIKDLTDSQAQQFGTIYRARRKDPQLILLVTLLGFVGISGVQRFILNQMGMGILYLLTAGLCFIGTIVDIVNYKSLAFQYNHRIAQEVVIMVKGLSS
jgi:TM2 domain-containing membrane protein YozV